MELELIQKIKGNEFNTLNELLNYLNSSGQTKNINTHSVLLWAKENYDKFPEGTSFYITAIQLIEISVDTYNGKKYYGRHETSIFNSNYLNNLNVDQLRSIMIHMDEKGPSKESIKYILASSEKGTISEKINFIIDSKPFFEVGEVFPLNKSSLNRILYAVTKYKFGANHDEYIRLISQEALHDIDYTQYIINLIRANYDKLPKNFIKECQEKYEESLKYTPENDFEELNGPEEVI